MRRLLWFGIGLAVGAIAVRQVSRRVRAYSPSGLAGSARQSAVGLVDSVRDFVADVREGMAEREADMRAAFARGVTLEELFDDERAHDDTGFDDDEDEVQENEAGDDQPGDAHPDHGLTDKNGVGVRR